MERERDIEAYIKRQVERLDGLYFKFVSPGNDGVPDRLVIVHGCLTFLELKTGRGVLSKVQEYQIQRLIDNGQRCCVVHGRAGAEAFVKDLASYVVSSIEYFDDGEDLLLDEWRS